jgi:hypothetical protein
VPKETKRYVAVVEILEVTETEAYKEYSNHYPATKESRELAKFTVRDEALLGLKEKVSSFTDLV